MKRAWLDEDLLDLGQGRGVEGGQGSLASGRQDRREAR